MMSQYMFLDRPALPPCPTSRAGELFAVRGLDSTHVWVAGAHTLTGPDRTGPFAARWDGSAWVDTAALADATYAPLVDLDLNSPTNLWASGATWEDVVARVGSYRMWQRSGSTWSGGGSDAGGGLTLLADGTTDPEGWVGETDPTYDPTSGDIFALHHASGGSTWPLEHPPPTGTHAGLRSPWAATSRGTGEVWLAGTFGAETFFGATAPYAERIVGASANSDFFPTSEDNPGWVHALLPVGTTRVYAAGAISLPDTSASTYEAAAWVYDPGSDTGWARLPLPPHPTGWVYSTFDGLGGTGTTDLWATGAWLAAAGADTISRPFLCHWDGSVWTQAFPDRPYAGVLSDSDRYGALLHHCWMRTPTDGWAVGRACLQMLILHYDGVLWSTVPLP